MKDHVTQRRFLVYGYRGMCAIILIIYLFVHKLYWVYGIFDCIVLYGAAFFWSRTVLRFGQRALYQELQFSGEIVWITEVHSTNKKEKWKRKPSLSLPLAKTQWLDGRLDDAYATRKLFPEEV